MQLQDLYVVGLQAFRAFYDLELHCLAFLKALKAARLNRGEVDEYVLSVSTANEAVTFRVVKPLHCSLFHLDSTLFLVNFLLRRSAATVRWRRRDYRRVQPKMGQIKLSLISMRCGWVGKGLFYFQDIPGHGGPPPGTWKPGPDGPISRLPLGCEYGRLKQRSPQFAPPWR